MKPKILITSLARHDDITASTTFQLAKEFTIDNDVLIVESPYTWTDLIKKEKSGLRWKATLTLNPLIVEIGPIKVLIPTAVLPINFLPSGKIYSVLQKLNQWIVSNSINRFLKKNKWTEYHYINSYCYQFPSIQKLLRGKQLSKTYHCVDPIIKSYTRKHGIANEVKAVQNVDQVISTASSLHKKWKQQTKKSYLVPNAADFKHFSRKSQLIADVRNLGKSIIGYFGNIERRIDYGLLTAYFSNKPDVTLLMAGPVDNTYVPDEFRGLNNVHFYGIYDYNELPDLIKSVDAAIIPFKCDKVSKDIYPLKLYEYMGTGKPVITTNFNPELLKQVDEVVYVIKNLIELSNAIEYALSEKEEKIKNERQEIASHNTWKDRADQFLSIIKHYQYASTN